jgi:hypothetical protein
MFVNISFLQKYTQLLDMIVASFWSKKIYELHSREKRCGLMFFFKTLLVQFSELLGLQC